ncbi:hypothetical protein RHGRI_002868 [Rhododendron griersonianum]|uniref:C2H2-type domain-containing protein n=1 Tax=Rhododendron griersonianum TaxID=479676 RepID=A0AAV6LTE4_9ERIC|nr:hypothetical protein RHGRI_002868 [Rhododendron griersonianum]
MEKANWMRSDKVKWDSSSTGTNMSFERDKTSGHIWPQRNYPCAFCKKQFKSAQALGGHMNIHRRERAQLRSSLVLSPNPTLDCPNPNPNSKPSFLVPHASHHSSLTTPSLGSLSSSKSSSTCIDDQEKMLLKAVPQSTRVDQRKSKIMRHGEFLGFGKLKNFMAQEEEEEDDDDDDECRVLKKKEKNGRSELGRGLVREGKEDLDLELRLGFSS